MISYLEGRHLLAMQEVLVRKYGGTLGLRDRGLFESAVAQPEQSAFGEDIFKTIPEKAAAYCFYLCQNHPFLDGNKRIAAAAAITFLRWNGFDLPVPQEELYETVIKIASGKLSRDKLTDWFCKNSVGKKGKSRKRRK